MELMAALRAKAGGPDLADRINREIKRNAHTKLAHATDLFPQFTDHSIRHSLQVLKILDWLVPDSVKEQLNEWELYFLVCSAYLHDLGMIESCPHPPEGPDWESYRADFMTRRGSQDGHGTDWGREAAANYNYIRDTHHVRSEEYIAANGVELGLRATDTDHEAWIVGRISRGHRKDDLSDPDLFGTIYFDVNRIIRMDLLAAYLRLADELDVTAFRTPLGEHKVMRITDPKSQMEWGKHISLSGVSAETGVIYIDGRCSDPDLYMRLVQLEKEIVQKLLEIRDAIPSLYVAMDGQHLRDPIPYHDVKLRLRHEGYFPIVVDFKLQDEAIINLIMGDQLYSERTACVREMLQNAVDTCREASFMRPRAWKPMITVEENVQEGIFTVTDNGMGMDERIVTEYFSRIGLSYYRSDEFTAAFNPISTFGIGILSCFMLADRIEIESKRDGSEPVRLELRSPTKPFVPRKGSRSEPGTEVRLHLKKDVKGEYDLASWARHYAKLVDIPIELVNPDASRETISQQDPIPDIDEIADRIFGRMESVRWKQQLIHRYLHSKNLKDYYGYTDVEGIQIGVLLLDKLFEEYEVDKSQGWSTLRSVGFSTVYQDGFYVSDLRAALMGSEMTWVVVNVTGDHKFELTADRSRYAGENLDVWRKVYSAYSEVMERLYRRFTPESNTEQWWEYHTRYYGKASSEVPSALEDSALKESEFCVFTSQGFRRYTLAEVRRDSGRLFWSRKPDHEHLMLFKSLLSDQDGIVVLPENFDWTPGGWIWTLANISPGHTLGECLRNNGATIFSRYILGAEAVLIDVGHQLGPWGIPVGWPNEAYDMRAAFDARHPLSQALLSLTDLDVPVSVELLAREVLESAPLDDIVDFQKLQGELLASLQRLGIVQEQGFDLQSVDRRSEPHKCPYPKARLEGISI